MKLFTPITAEVIALAVISKAKMKTNLSIRFFAAVFLFAGCKEHPGEPVKTGPVVYVSGYANLVNAVYWKNGVQMILGNAFSTTNIALSGDDVYIAGNIGFAVAGGGSANAAYWKNGSLNKLGNDPSYANSIAVSGTDIYVCGNAMVNNSYVAAYWKNGVL